MQNYGNEVEILKDGTVLTTSANGSKILDTVNKSTLRALLVATAASGTTPSLTVTVQTSADKGVTDTWRDVAAFTAVTAAGSQRKSFVGLDRWTRIKWAITGTTPSVTLGISGELV